MAESKSVRIGPGLLGCLGILFVALKLCGQIDWPWLWVLAPFWGPVAVLAIMFVLGSVVVGVLFVGSALLENFGRKE